MITRLLIANRGEIAVRIIRACRELGVTSIAVHSDADADARHVRIADQAVSIGPAPSASSYLNIRAIIGAARATGADAVHPGYGFLSENPDFALACSEADLIFVGPPAAVIASLGSKIEARRLMRDAGVPIVPGDTPEDQSDEGLSRAIQRVGLPALVKASAGGGGKGMRLVREAPEAVAAIQAARREAMAAFGDGTLYVERLLTRAHHVEVQVMADANGASVHVFERECSVQRRHQKVLEETPSPSINAELRERITSAALLAARAAGYRNAGTVEFLVDPVDRSFYFLEMNTRLQVEHPVTEQVVGVDLVRAQLLVAAGQGLPWKQHELVQRGHAIEARVYAEDPERGFLPQAGRLLLYREPHMPGVRVDSGVDEGDQVSVHYDPMLAKVIASAETRELAIARLVAALREFPILGIRTNIPFLLRILGDPRFRSGEVDTSFLDREAESLAQLPADSAIPPRVRAAIDSWSTPAGLSAAIGLSAASGLSATSAPAPVSGSRSSWDPWSGRPLAPPTALPSRHELPTGPSLPAGATLHEGVYVARAGQTSWAFWNGHVYREDVHAGHEAASSASDSRSPSLAGSVQPVVAHAVTAPMPGTVLKIFVTHGTIVSRGDTVVILEAMKMELPIAALDDAIVVAVRCKEGDLVEAEATLVEFAPRPTT